MTGAEVWPSVTAIREDARIIDVKRLRWNLYTWHIEALDKVWIGIGSRADLEDAYVDFKRTLRTAL